MSIVLTSTKTSPLARSFLYGAHLRATFFAFACTNIFVCRDFSYKLGYIALAGAVTCFDIMYEILPFGVNILLMYLAPDDLLVVLYTYVV